MTQNTRWERKLDLMSSISCVTDRDQTETRALTLGPPQCAIRLWMKNRTEYCMTINRISKCFFEISRLGYTEICKLLYKAVIPGCQSTVIGVFGEEYCASITFALQQRIPCLDHDRDVRHLLSAISRNVLHHSWYHSRHTLNDAATSYLPPYNRLFRSHEIPEIRSSIAAVLQE